MDEKPFRTEGTSEVIDAGSASRSRTSGLWIGMVLSALVLVFLLIFILQNRDLARITFLGWSGALPTGVALLFAAIAGVLLVAIPGSVRILQLRRAAARNGDRTRTTSHRN
jgi:lipopolysaccharide assembly protein A